MGKKRDETRAVAEGTGRGAREPYAVELHVEAAGITHGLALRVAAPQRGGGGLAVGAGEAHSAGGRLQHRRQTLQAQGRCHVICFTASDRGAGPRESQSLCPRKSCSDAAMPGCWELGTPASHGCMRPRAGLPETANPGRSCCVSDIISHSRQGKAEQPLGTVGRKTSPKVELTWASGPGVGNYCVPETSNTDCKRGKQAPGFIPSVLPSLISVKATGQK